LGPFVSLARSAQFVLDRSECVVSAEDGTVADLIFPPSGLPRAPRREIVVDELQGLLHPRLKLLGTGQSELVAFALAVRQQPISIVADGAQGGLGSAPEV